MDATSLIQFKRATAANISSYVPADGEPFYDKTNSRLYIGDGSTPSGILLNTSDTLTSHLIADRTGGIGPYHTIVCNEKDVLVGTGTNTAVMRQLTFNDLDSNGGHAMLNHSGSIFAIWYSHDETSSLVPGGYQVKPLRYDVAEGGRDGSGIDTTSTAGSVYALTVKYRTTNGYNNNYLDFRQIGFGDLTGTIADAALLTEFSTANDWAMFYSNADGLVQDNVNLGAVGTYLAGKGANVAPEFKRIDIADITGTATTLGALTATTANKTIRSNGSAWVDSTRISHDDTITDVGHANIILKATTAINEELIKYIRNDGNTIYSIIGRFYGFNNTQLNNRLTFISNTADTTGADIDFWCSEKRTSTSGYGSNMSDITGTSPGTYFPDIRFNTYGSILLKSQIYDNTSAPFTQDGQYVTPFFAGDRQFNVKSNATIPGFYGFRINSLKLYKDHASNAAQQNSAYSLAAFSCGSIDCTSHATQTSDMPDSGFLHCGDLALHNSTANGYAMKFGKMTGKKSLYGLYLHDITSSSTSTSDAVVGISITKLNTASANVRKAGIYISVGDDLPYTNIPSDTTSYAIYVKSGKCVFDTVDITGDIKISYSKLNRDITGGDITDTTNLNIENIGNYNYIEYNMDAIGGNLTITKMTAGRHGQMLIMKNNTPNYVTRKITFTNDDWDQGDENLWGIHFKTSWGTLEFAHLDTIMFVGNNDTNSWDVISYTK